MKNLKAENAILRRALDIASKSRVRICCREYLGWEHSGVCVCTPRKCQEYIKAEFIRLAKEAR